MSSQPAAPAAQPESASSTMEVLRAVERGEISVDEALRAYTAGDAYAASHDVEQLARSLIPDHDGADKSWRGYARTFFTAVARQTNDAGIRRALTVVDFGGRCGGVAAGLCLSRAGALSFPGQGQFSPTQYGAAAVDIDQALEVGQVGRQVRLDPGPESGEGRGGRPDGGCFHRGAV